MTASQSVYRDGDMHQQRCTARHKNPQEVLKLWVRGNLYQSKSSDHGHIRYILKSLKIHMVDFVASVCRHCICEGGEADCIVNAETLKVNPMPSSSVHYFVFSSFLCGTIWGKGSPVHHDMLWRLNYWRIRCNWFLWPSLLMLFLLMMGALFSGFSSISRTCAFLT